MLEFILIVLIVAALTGISVIADFTPSRLYCSEWHLRRSQRGYRPAVRRFQ